MSVVLAELALASLLGYGLWATRQQALNAELKMLSSLAAAMSVQADNILDIADDVLRATRAELDDGLQAADGQKANDFLRNRVSTLNKFRALVLVDERGNRVATSREDPSPPVSLSEREFFRMAQNNANSEIFIGSPYLSRTDGKLSLPISLARRSDNGIFQGALVLVADPEFLDGDFTQIAPAKDTSMAIYRRDRTLISDGPGDGIKNLLPQSILETIWQRDLSEPTKLLNTTESGQRLVASHRLRRFPLMVVITRRAQVVLTSWTEQAVILSTFALTGLVATLWLSILSKKRELQKQEEQRTLQAEQERTGSASEHHKDSLNDQG